MAKCLYKLEDDDEDEMLKDKNAFLEKRKAEVEENVLEMMLNQDIEDETDKDRRRTNICLK